MKRSGVVSTCALLSTVALLGVRLFGQEKMDRAESHKIVRFVHSLVRGSSATQMRREEWPHARDSPISRLDA